MEINVRKKFRKFEKRGLYLWKRSGIIKIVKE